MKMPSPPANNIIPLASSPPEERLANTRQMLDCALEEWLAIANMAAYLDMNLTEREARSASQAERPNPTTQS